MGLFISKKIIESYGGNILAENNYSDGREGAAFAFILATINKLCVDFFLIELGKIHH